MKKYMIIIGSLIAFIASPLANAKDVTSLVIQHTNLAERIRDACNRSCQGNRRAGTLNRVTVRRENQSHHIVDIWASLKNHQHQNSLIGGGFAVYQYTIGVHATGRLDQRNCNITILNISVSGDSLGIANGAHNERGKTYNVSNCHKFI